MKAKLPRFPFLLPAIWLGLLGALLPLAASGQDRLDKTGWQLDPNLSEDFNGGTTPGTLAPRWWVELESGPLFHSNSKLYFEPYVTRDNVYIANGCAYLNTFKYPEPIYQANGRDYHYSTASLRSRFDDFPTINPENDGGKGGVLYGMFEIRCKLPSRSGQFPTFWLSGNNAWPPEVDVFEFNASHPKYFFSTVHWANPAFGKDSTAEQSLYYGNNYSYRRNNYLTKDFHTWTLVWTPAKITWFFDDKELITDTVLAHIPGAITPATNPYELCKYGKMDLLVSALLNYPDSAETTFEPFVVDYIHMYRPPGFVPYREGQNIDDYIAGLNLIYQKAIYKMPGRKTARTLGDK